MKVKMIFSFLRDSFAWCKMAEETISAWKKNFLAKFEASEHSQAGFLSFFSLLLPSVYKWKGSPPLTPPPSPFHSSCPLTARCSYSTDIILTVGSSFCCSTPSSWKKSNLFFYSTWLIQLWEVIHQGFVARPPHAVRISRLPQLIVACPFLRFELPIRQVAAAKTPWPMVLKVNLKPCS